MQPKNSRTSFGPLSLPGMNAGVSHGESDEAINEAINNSHQFLG